LDTRKILFFKDKFSPKERNDTFTTDRLRESYWRGFMNQTFSGYNIFDNLNIETFDWMLLLLNGKADQKAAITAVLLFDYCREASYLYHTTCLQTMLQGVNFTSILCATFLYENVLCKLG
jgi:hypothetical protein